MKNRISIIVLAMALVASMGCQDKLLETYEFNTPVYMSYDLLRSSVYDTLPIEFEHPGKIYIKDNYLFINEVMEGIHIVDNSDPSAPEVITFINIPGNVDLAIMDNTLFADSYLDLVVLDISDLDDIREVNRIEDVFDYSLPAYEADERLGQIDESQGVVVDWSKKKVTEEVEDPSSYGYPMRGWSGWAMEDAMFSSSMGPQSAGSTGTGGSMARFIIYNEVLYTIDQSNLHLFNLSDATSPLSEGDYSIGWNIETVFIARDHLFIGAQSGMYIYDLYDPVNPDYVSTYWHVTSCDPVVVQGDYAYVTLRTGNLCQGDSNQLNVVFIKNLENPQLLKSYEMVNPHGLGIDDDKLFICDGEAGLKVYWADDPLNITRNKIAQFEDINAFDVIPLGDLLILIGEEGLYQYDYSDVTEMVLLSVLPIFD
jgi:hypothetical protein